jgi:hypothetical protein
METLFPLYNYSAGRAAGTSVKTARYFQAMRSRPDRAIIQTEWIERVMRHLCTKRSDPQMGTHRRDAGRLLRVVLLPDGETVHNAFFDRSFKP